MINLVYTILCILCMCIGFFVGSRIAKGNTTEIKKIPIVNPIEKIKKKIEEKKDNEEIREQLDELNKIYENIENYDGTSNNQKELKNIEIGIL